MAKRQCGRRHDVGWWRRLTLPSQDVEHDISGMNAVSDRFGAGGLNCWQTVGQHRVEDVDHLPIAVIGAGKLSPHTRSIAAGSTQSLKGAPLRKAPGLRIRTGT